MKAFLILIATALIISKSIGQEIANCIEILENDSIKFYFKSHGILVDKECADYYRIAKMNPSVYAFNGYSKDYYTTGEIAAECYYSNNLLNGSFKSYYKNGQLKEKGKLANGQKIGEWRYWFKNGQLKRLIIFSDYDYYLKEAYNIKGKKLITNGNGRFIDYELQPGNKIKGDIKNGKQHGSWVVYNSSFNSNTAIEKYENGEFIEGQNIASVQSLNTKYFDKPSILFDQTIDLLKISYHKKIECLLYGTSHTYKHKSFNSQYGFLSFYDYIYMNFDPVITSEGYIIVGFKINKEGDLGHITHYSTTRNEAVEMKLIRVLSSSEKWSPETHNNKPIESTEVLVFQFFKGGYKILNDSRNDFPNSLETLDYGAKFGLGNDSLVSYVIDALDLPKTFHADSFNLSACYEFSINEKGELVDGDGEFINRLRVSDNEKLLYNALENSLKNTGPWQPATFNGVATKQYFIAVLNIINGKPKLRFISKNWVLE